MSTEKNHAVCLAEALKRLQRAVVNRDAAVATGEKDQIRYWLDEYSVAQSHATKEVAEFEIHRRQPVSPSKETPPV